MKQVDKTTRAPRAGRLIFCPHCEHVAWVFHFSWAALTCGGCARMVDKTDWKTKATQ